MEKLSNYGSRMLISPKKKWNSFSLTLLIRRWKPKTAENRLSFSSFEILKKKWIFFSVPFVLRLHFLPSFTAVRNFRISITHIINFKIYPPFPSFHSLKVSVVPSRAWFMSRLETNSIYKGWSEGFFLCWSYLWNG